jgi:FAD/FMN-containing dehydrogenase
LPLAVGDTALETMASIKRLFDPRGILNPGKIFVE